MTMECTVLDDSNRKHLHDDKFCLDYCWGYEPKDIYILQNEYINDMPINAELEKSVREIVNEEIEKFKKDNERYKLMSDLKAEEEIIELLKIFKEKEKSRVDILEITSFLNLPIKQVGKIIHKLEKEGILREDA